MFGTPKCVCYGDVFSTVPFIQSVLCCGSTVKVLRLWSYFVGGRASFRGESGLTGHSGQPLLGCSSQEPPVYGDEAQGRRCLQISTVEPLIKDTLNTYNRKTYI